MTTRECVWTGVVLFAIAIAFIYPYSPGGMQAANMHQAQQHIAVIGSQIAADPRFAKIHMEPGTADGGNLTVWGELPTQADIDALKAIIVRSKSPVPLAFHVYLPFPATQP